MNRYENAKYLVKRKAKKAWTCAACDAPIQPGDEYYRETMAPINPGPGMRFYPYCSECGSKIRETKEVMSTKRSFQK